MKQEHFTEIETKILEKLDTLFSEQQLLTQWQSKENNNTVDMLLVEHTGMGGDGGEVLGCYYFLPEDGSGGNIHQFLLAMTITEQLNSWNLDYMREAISRINFILPAGCFVIDHKGQILSYRVGIPFLADEEEGRMMELIGYHIVESAQYVSLWMDVLLDLNAGKISYDEFENFLQLCMTPIESD